MHTAPITRIAVDGEERYLVTGSEDKTIKVWELKTGKLIKTLRLPIGDGGEGTIRAVAISPDGKYVAGGGYTCYWDPWACIYIFDLERGEIYLKMMGFSSAILHLAYSKDGRYLAVALEEGGVLIYNARNYLPEFEDYNFKAPICWVDFSQDGRFAVVSLDGRLTIYTPGRGVYYSITRKLSGGKYPYSVAFPPDGSQVVVGYEDSQVVEVFSSLTLEKLYSANTFGPFFRCHFGRVAFSADGSFLYAGGNCGYPKVIRRWRINKRTGQPYMGKYNHIDIPVVMNTIMQILPLRDGGVVFATMEPSFGVVNKKGKLVYKKVAEKADLRGQIDKFEVSYDGSMVKFIYDPFSGSPVVFDVLNRRFLKSASGLSKPITEHPELLITDWLSSYSTKLNGKKLLLEKFEISRSLAISPDGKSFLLGTNGRLLLFNKNGKLLWSTPTPGEAWAVNISGNGKLAVAGFGDGTIRWYRMKDGKEVLAFFPHIDGKRWVLWTPEGYYDASPSAEELFGWHINNGKNKTPSFYPAETFKADFHRPDMIDKVFGL